MLAVGDSHSTVFEIYSFEHGVLAALLPQGECRFLDMALTFQRGIFFGALLLQCLVINEQVELFNNGIFLYGVLTDKVVAVTLILRTSRFLSTTRSNSSMTIFRSDLRLQPDSCATQLVISAVEPRFKMFLLLNSSGNLPYCTLQTTSSAEIFQHHHLQRKNSDCRP